MLRPFGCAGPVAAILGILLSAGPAAGQSQDAAPFEAATGPHRLLSLHAARTLPHLGFWAGISLGYANDPAIARLNNRPAARLIQHRVGTEVALAFGLWSRLELAAALPAFLTQRSDNYNPPGGPPEGGGLGDLRISLKGRLWQGAGFGFAAVAEVTLPTGDRQGLRGEGVVTVLPRLVADYRHSIGLHIALNVAYRLRPQRQLEDLAMDDELHFGVGLEQRLGIAGLSAGAELDVALGLGTLQDDDPTISLRKSPMELYGFLRWRGWRDLTATLSAGSGVTEGLGAADLRVVLSLGWVISPSSPAPARGALVRKPTSHPATSRPVVTKPKTPAPLTPKHFDKLAKADPDRDGDGLPDSRDRCPSKPEDRDNFQDDDGCPDPDNDRDGVPDTQDRCPLEPEVVNGVDDDDGCPDKGKSRVVLSGKQLKLLDAKVYFRSGSDVLEGRSRPILREVAAALRAYWTIRKLRVEGHTDNRGDKEMNVDLSERRARRVREFMIARGVAAHRLVAKGYGPTKPIAKNRSRAGRAKNRRVVFEVLEKVDPAKATAPKRSPRTTKGGSR
jgi:outer membrane protein OmpA-like peptidoglycan-associated protein